jgi:ketosteroid isomerase-like protein
MTSESVELVSRAFSAFNRRDEAELLSLCHADIEWIPMRSSAQGRVYRGHDGVREALADVGTEFEELRNDPRRWLDLGERVVVAGRLVAKERRGGLRIDIPAAWLCEVREGKVAYLRAFPDEEPALSAARERE